MVHFEMTGFCFLPILLGFFASVSGRIVTLAFSLPLKLQARLEGGRFTSIATLLSRMWENLEMGRRACGRKHNGRLEVVEKFGGYRRKLNQKGEAKGTRKAFRLQILEQRESLFLVDRGDCYSSCVLEAHKPCQNGSDGLPDCQFG